ncbi:unnamed protein product [Chrysoparadoxa australica]
MIKVHRIYYVFRKDIIWAINNPKMLSIMLMPIFFIILFSKIGKTSTIAFSINFTSAFIGILSTSQMILEEKKNGTLQSILISPLKNAEYLIGKYLFSLLLILIFDFASFLLNQVPHLILNPYLIFSLIAYSGFATLIGCFLGLFFQDEKESGVIAPFFLLIFMIGDLFSKIPITAPYASLFPSYHLSLLITQNDALNFKDSIFHLSFNCLYLFLSFVLTVSYSKYYFSPKYDGRYTNKLTIPLVTLVISQFISFHLDNFLLNDMNKKLNNNLSKIPVDFKGWVGDIEYEKGKILFDKTFVSSNKLHYRFVDPELYQSIHIIIEEKEEPIIRPQKLNTLVLGEFETQSKTLIFKRTISTWNGSTFIDVNPISCENYNLKFRIESEKDKLFEFFEVVNFLDKILSSINLRCLR